MVAPNGSRLMNYRYCTADGGNSDQQKPRDSHCFSISFNPATLPWQSRGFHPVTAELTNSTMIQLIYISLFIFITLMIPVKHTEAVLQSKVFKITAKLSEW